MVFAAAGFQTLSMIVPFTTGTSPLREMLQLEYKRLEGVRSCMVLCSTHGKFVTALAGTTVVKTVVPFTFSRMVNVVAAPVVNIQLCEILTVKPAGVGAGIVSEP